MKFRDSGMPSEQMWSSFFDQLRILSQMEIANNIELLLDIGCGYGTFLIPASQIISGQVVGVDIEKEMINVCSQKISEFGIKNVELICEDISSASGLSTLNEYKGKVEYITLFNILHCENPQELLNNAYNLLKTSGKVGVIHWIPNNTPRGPRMEIRPKPESIIEWAEKIGLTLIKEVDLPPYHFGLVFEFKPKKPVTNIGVLTNKKSEE